MNIRKRTFFSGSPARTWRTRRTPPRSRRRRESSTKSLSPSFRRRRFRWIPRCAKWSTRTCWSPPLKRSRKLSCRFFSSCNATATRASSIRPCTEKWRKCPAQAERTRSLKWRWRWPPEAVREKTLEKKNSPNCNAAILRRHAQSNQFDLNLKFSKSKTWPKKSRALMNWRRLELSLELSLEFSLRLELWPKLRLSLKNKTKKFLQFLFAILFTLYPTDLFLASQAFRAARPKRKPKNCHHTSTFFLLLSLPLIGSSNYLPEKLPKTAKPTTSFSRTGDQLSACTIWPVPEFISRSGHSDHSAQSKKCPPDTPNAYPKYIPLYYPRSTLVVITCHHSVYDPPFDRDCYWSPPLFIRENPTSSASFYRNFDVSLLQKYLAATRCFQQGSVGQPCCELSAFKQPDYSPRRLVRQLCGILNPKSGRLKITPDSNNTLAKNEKQKQASVSASQWLVPTGSYY